jgi:CRP-like cAMP-binding protein
MGLTLQEVEDIARECDAFDVPWSYEKMKDWDEDQVKEYFEDQVHGAAARIQARHRGKMVRKLNATQTAVQTFAALPVQTVLQVDSFKSTPPASTKSTPRKGAPETEGNEPTHEPTVLQRSPTTCSWASFTTTKASGSGGKADEDTHVPTRPSLKDAPLLQRSATSVLKAAAAIKVQAMARGISGRKELANRRANKTKVGEQEEKIKRMFNSKRKEDEEKKELAKAVQQKSLMNSAQRRSWLLDYFVPNKPTRLFIFDVAYRAIKLDKKAFPKLNRCVLVPSGYWRVVFAYVMLFAAGADVFLCSTAVGFCREVYAGPINVLISLLFACEMCLGFITAYPTKDASLELRPDYIAARYLRTSFMLHLPGLLPLEQGATEPGVRRVWQYMRVLRFFDVWYRHDSFRSVTSTANDGVMDAFKYAIFTAVVAHTFSTIFFSFAVVDNTICTVDTSTGWLALRDDDAIYATIEEHNAFDARSPLPHEAEGWKNYSNLYVYYLYATVAMLLGDAAAARTRDTQAVAIVILIMGNISFSVVFSKIILALQAQTAARDAYANKMMAVNDAMDSQGVPRPLQRRVRRFYEFKYMLMAGLDDPATSYIAELPNAMRVDIMTSLYNDMLKDVPLFYGCSNTVISALAQQLRTRLILPDEIVIKEGCVGNSMYFIRRGLVRVVRGYKTDEEFFIAGLGSGSYFGEVALVSSSTDERRAATVVAATVLSLLRLSRKALHEVAENEPALLMHIRKVATTRRRELGEDLRDIGTVAMMLKGANKFRARLKSEVRRSGIDDLEVQSVRTKAKRNGWSTNITTLRVLDTLRGGAAGALRRSGSSMRSEAVHPEPAVDGAGDTSGTDGCRTRPPLVASRSAKACRGSLPESGILGTGGLGSSMGRGGMVGLRTRSRNFSQEDVDVVPEVRSRLDSDQLHVSALPMAPDGPLGRAHANISHDATERIIEWMRTEMNQLMHQKLDEKLTEILRDVLPP